MLQRSIFSNLFSTQGADDPDHILAMVDRYISKSMNQALIVEWKLEEIYSTLKDMEPTKSFGADGLPTLLFQKYWHIFSWDIGSFCLDVLERGTYLETLIITHIVLIPKISHPNNLMHFHLINICTLFYKLISKTIINRLQKVLDICIDEA